MVVLANRNGFYYALDRVSESSSPASLCEADLGESLDEAGRPMRLPKTDLPSRHVAVAESWRRSNWYSSTYSPKSDLYYVNARSRGHLPQGRRRYRAGALFNGGGQREYKDEDAYGASAALEVATGKLSWEFKLHSPSHAGLMSTAGGLVFGSNASSFFALTQKRATCYGDSRAAATSTPIQSLI